MNRIGVFAVLTAATMSPLASSLVAEQPVHANVPFEFSVANRNLPAGEYRIERHGAFLSIENRDTLGMVTLLATPGEPSKDGRSFLSFEEVNGVLVLRSVATPDEQSSVEVVASKTKKPARERELQRLSVDDPRQ